MKNSVFIISLIAVSLFSSCKKKWEDTGKLELKFNAIQTQVNSKFKVTQAVLTPIQFSWYGQRKQSGSVTIEKSFSPAARITLLDGTFNETPSIEIPQGTYTDIISSFRFKGNSNSKTFEITAEYQLEMDDEEETVILNIQLEAEEIAKMAGLIAPIDLVSEQSYTLNLNIDFGYLLSGINDYTIEDAEVENEVLLINSVNNPSLYSMISGRINNSMTLKMN